MTDTIRHMIYDDKSQAWLLNGVCHREGGPAYITAEGETWCYHGNIHRLDGPAVIRVDGIHRWFVHGLEITTRVQQWMQEQNLSWPWDKQTQAQFVLTFA